MNIFEQYTRHQRGPHFFEAITRCYTVMSNQAGATITDTHEWRELTLFGATLFWSGREGRDQAEQYIHEYGSLLSPN